MNNLGIKYIIYLTCIFIVLFTSFGTIHAQVGKSSKKNTSGASLKLSKSLEKKADDATLVSQYEEAAKEARENKQYSIAEDYLTKAKAIYEKKGNKEKAAELDREIAKLQEHQKEIDKAIKSYESASQNSIASLSKQANTNDAQRLQMNKNPHAQSKLIQSNIAIFDEINKPEEKVLANQQLADVNLQLDRKEEAIANLKEALSEVENPEVKIEISKNIADIYTSEREYDKAISINKDLVEESKKTDNPRNQARQLRELSDAYLKKDDIESSIESLFEAYHLAMDRGQTMEAKKSLEEIVKLYLKEKKDKKALDSYADFISRLETVMTSDTTLMDAQMYNLISDKIRQLEKEREMNDLLIARKNTLNYSLIAIITLILIFLLLAVKALYSINRKNKKIALQSLRREMNPHFIFNSLNSVNQFIAQNNELEANKYLSSYSGLMRTMMENSNNDFIPLIVEMEQLRKYLELEYMRFNDKFDYEINIAETIDPDSILVPNMLIQPHLENAIWHGLRYAEDKGLLQLTIRERGSQIEVVVEDNGIGIERSKELKTKHQKKYQSRGMTNTEERVKLLNNIYNTHISIHVRDKNSGVSGVVVTICFPRTTK